MTLDKLLTLCNIQEDVWTTLPDVRTIEFSNQRYLYTSEHNHDIIRWFMVLDTDDNDPVLLLQNRTVDNSIIPGGITYDGVTDVHQIFFISEIDGITLR